MAAAVLAFGLFAVARPAAAQAAAGANKTYQTPEGRANIAKTLSAHDRDARQRPRDLVAELGLRSGMTVADIGTGVGYMLPYLAEAVGAQGRVLAEDIFPDFLEKARATAAKHNLTNVEFILGTERDPKLPAQSVDVVLILDAYHHFDFPSEMLALAGRALKKGGRLVIVEYHKEHFRDPAHIRFTDAQLLAEVQSNGYELLSSTEFTPKSQFLAIFSKKPVN